MADIKLNITEEVPVVVVEEVKAVKVKTSATSTGKSFQDKTPCNWAITPAEDGGITAYNSSSKETFTGAIVDFNAALRA